MHNFLITVIFLGISFVVSCLLRKFGSHTLINGYMSKEKADAVFPEWRKK